MENTTCTIHIRIPAQKFRASEQPEVPPPACLRRSCFVSYLSPRPLFLAPRFLSPCPPFSSLPNACSRPPALLSPCPVAIDPLHENLCVPFFHSLCTLRSPRLSRHHFALLTLRPSSPLAGQFSREIMRARRHEQRSEQRGKRSRRLGDSEFELGDWKCVEKRPSLRTFGYRWVGELSVPRHWGERARLQGRQATRAVQIWWQAGIGSWQERGLDCRVI